MFTRESARRGELFPRSWIHSVVRAFDYTFVLSSSIVIDPATHHSFSFPVRNRHDSENIASHVCLIVRFCKTPGLTLAR
jgi:hypothetical protein